MNKLHFPFAAAMALALCVAATPARAAPVAYDFKVTVDTSGPLAGQMFQGHFSFDDSVGQASGGETLYALGSFSFDFNGNSYGLLDLSVSDAVFIGNAATGQFNGLDVAAKVFSLLPAFGGQDPFLAFNLGAGNTGNGSVRYTLAPNAVPEPGSAALALAALALIGLRRRWWVR